MMINDTTIFAKKIATLLQDENYRLL